MQSAKTAAKLPQRPRGFTIWMTGLPGSGKSTLAGMLKEKFEDEYGRFVEVLDGDEVRKGLYAKARRGEINNMTGLQDPYEEPTSPDITVDTERNSQEECVDEIIKRLIEMGFLDEPLV